jgi:hypothetical protein
MILNYVAHSKIKSGVVLVKEKENLMIDGPAALRPASQACGSH